MAATGACRSSPRTRARASPTSIRPCNTVTPPAAVSASACRAQNGSWMILKSRPRSEKARRLPCENGSRMIPTANTPRLVDWAVAQKAAPGQTVSGDLHLTQPHERGVLLAVVDGLGHGPEASRAAIIAIDALRQQPSDSVHALTNRCHAALTRTRGVVMTLASFDSADRTITWCGIGNVEARLFRYDANGTTSPENALLRGGTVGSQLPVQQGVLG